MVHTLSASGHMAWHEAHVMFSHIELINNIKLLSCDALLLSTIALLSMQRYSAKNWTAEEMRCYRIKQTGNLRAPSVRIAV